MEDSEEIKKRFSLWRIKNLISVSKENEIDLNRLDFPSVNEIFL